MAKVGVILSSIKGDSHFAHSALLRMFHKSDCLLAELLFHPRRFLHGDLFEDRAIFGVRAGQISCGHQKFVDDLPACEDEGLLQDLNTITTVKE
jgi:hypothetical protein